MKDLKHRYLIWIYILVVCTLPSCFGGEIGCSGDPEVYEGISCVPPRIGGYSCLGNPRPYPAVDLTAIDTDTPVYLEISLPTDTPNPFESKPYFTLDGNAFCRAGFSQEYHEIEVLLSGSNYPVEGQNEDGSWLLLATGEHLCWVSIVTGSTLGSLDEVDFVVAPTRTPIYIAPAPDPVQEEGCAKYKDEMSCMDHFVDGCNWIIPSGNAPYCTEP